MQSAVSLAAESSETRSSRPVRSGSRRNVGGSPRSGQQPAARGSRAPQGGSLSSTATAALEPAGATQKKVVLRGGGGVAKSKSAPTLQEQARDRPHFSLPLPDQAGSTSNISDGLIVPESDPRDWLVENSERLIAQTEKCLVAHLHLQQLLGSGEAACASAGRPPGPEDVPPHLAVASADIGSGASAAPAKGTQSRGSSPERTPSAEPPQARPRGKVKSGSAQAAAQLAALCRRRVELRSDLDLATTEACRLEDELASARAAAQQFQEAVSLSCEAELGRLDAEAKELEEQIVERRHLLLRHFQGASTPQPPGNLPNPGPRTASHAATQPLSAAAVAAAAKRGPAQSPGPAVSSRGPSLGRPAAPRGPLSPPRRPVAGGSSASQPAAAKAPAATARRQLPRTATPGSSPRRRPNADVRFAPLTRGSTTPSHAVQLRTPPRGSQPGAAAVGSSRSASSPKTPRGNSGAGASGGGSSGSGSARAASGAVAGRWQSPPGMVPISTLGAAQQCMAPTQARAASGTTPAGGVAAAARAASAANAASGTSATSGSPGIPSAPNAPVAIAAAASAAAAAAAQAAQAARSASPASVVQNLQRLETARCQAQAEFWAH